MCGYKHLWRALMHTRACLLKETGTYTLSSERIIETEGEINIQLLCGAYLLYYSLLRNFCVVFPLLLFKSPCLSICLFPQSISPFSEFTKDDNFGITLSIPSTERERQHTARNTKMSFMLFLASRLSVSAECDNCEISLYKDTNLWGVGIATSINTQNRHIHGWFFNQGDLSVPYDDFKGKKHSRYPKI